MIASLVIAIGLVTLDNTVMVKEFWETAPWFLRGSADGTRTMLGSISTAVLTVTTLAFSLMMVSVVQTANAYSPRIISQYLSDRHNQHVLGILLGTFLYTLLVLRSISDNFVPLLAVNVAILAAIIATIALVSFINHVAQSIKVSNIAQLILSQSIKVIEEGFPENVGQAWAFDSPTHSEQGGLIYAQDTGYLQLLDGQELLEIATNRQVVIRLQYTVGDHVLANAPLAEVWPANALDTELAEAVLGSVIVGPERTDTQDIRFGIRQLVDIALRALSPGVNDPTTATDMINALKQVLAAKLRVGVAAAKRADEEGTLRLILFPLPLNHLIEEAFVEILHYGAADFATIRELLRTVGQLCYLATEPEHQENLWNLLGQIVSVAQEHIGTELESELLNEVLRETTAVFERNMEIQELSIRAVS